MARPAFLDNKWTRRALAVLFFVAVFLAIGAWQARNLAQGPAPRFELLALDNEIISPARYAGQPHVIYFWATWCPVCGMQRGAIESVAEDYPVIAVALGEDAGTVREYFNDAATPLHVVPDTDAEVARRYGVHAVPAIFIIDAQGNITARSAGYTTEAGLRLRLFLSR